MLLSEIISLFTAIAYIIYDFCGFVKHNKNVKLSVMNVEFSEIFKMAFLLFVYK